MRFLIFAVLGKPFEIDVELATHHVAKLQCCNYLFSRVFFSVTLLNVFFNALLVNGALSKPLFKLRNVPFVSSSSRWVPTPNLAEPVTSRRVSFRDFCACIYVALDLFIP